MDKITTLKKSIMKIKFLSSLLITFLCFNSSFAEIIYTDIEDVNIATATYTDIDFTNDEEAEFTFEATVYDNGILETNITFINNNYRFATISNNLWDHTTALTINDVVDENTGWNDYGYAAIYDDFATNEDAYIAVQFPLEDGQHYGWIRVLWNGSDAFVIKDFAYNSVPETSIEAGDKGTTPGLGLIENNTLYHNAFPNPSQGELHFNLDKPIHELYIYNTNGQLVCYRKVISNQVDISFLPIGYYTLQYQDSKENLYRETLIKH